MYWGRAMSFDQIHDAQRRDSLRTIAVLRMEPGDLSERFGLRFDSGADDLGESLGALVQTASGRQFALMRYLDSPTQGTEVLASESSGDPATELHDFLDAFG